MSSVQRMLLLGRINVALAAGYTKVLASEKLLVQRSSIVVALYTQLKNDTRKVEGLENCVVQGG